jgi:hypothetical protein
MMKWMQKALFYGEPIGMLIILLTLIFQFLIVDLFANDMDDYRWKAINYKVDDLSRYTESIGEGLKKGDFQYLRNPQEGEESRYSFNKSLADENWKYQSDSAQKIYYTSYILGTVFIIIGKFYERCLAYKSHGNDADGNKDRKPIRTKVKPSSYYLRRRKRIKRSN